MNQIGHKIIHLDVVDSTNNYAANLAKEQNIVHGTVILADEQTNGRGQRGTIWQAQPGMNLIFSLFVQYPDFPVEKQPSIHHWVSLSLFETLKKTGIRAVIKWPNDVLTGNGKIAGILIENALSEGFVRHSVIGIGLNVNQSEFPDVKATSVRLETGLAANISEIAFMLINELNNRFSRLIQNDLAVLKKEYLQQLWGMNQEVSFLRNDLEEKGIIRGTDDLGKLEVETINGTEYFDLKEVKFIL